jgi:lamin tail-like protein
MRRVRLLAALLTLAVLVIPPAAGSGTGAIVISQLFGGGGNAGAPFASDYVELFNKGSSAVDVTGWSVQYATAAGVGWSATPLSGSIAPGRSYLVELAGGATGAALPTPDATGSTNMAATAGKVALVRAAAALTCGASAGSCSSAANLEDLVGYGTAADFEGSGAAPAPSSTNAIIRAGQGCNDSDVNSADFATGAPAPHNSASAAHACAGGPPPGGPSASASASVAVDLNAVLSISLERASLDFGAAASGSTPTPISERVTVLSNHPAGYGLSVQRTTFSPADLPLGIQASAPAGGTLGSGLGGSGLAAVPIAPVSLQIGTTSAASPSAGDVWPTNVGFASALPSVAPGRYTATLTFTVIGR